MLKEAKKLDPAVTDVDLDSLLFDFMPVAFGIYGATESDTLAYLDSFDKRNAGRSAAFVSRARRCFFRQLSHSIWACYAQAILLRTPVKERYISDMAC